jgi:hypothetical protein
MFGVARALLFGRHGLFSNIFVHIARVLQNLLTRSYHPFDEKGEANRAIVLKRISCGDFAFNDRVWDHVSSEGSVRITCATASLMMTVATTHAQPSVFWLTSTMRGRRVVFVVLLFCCVSAKDIISALLQVDPSRRMSLDAFLNTSFILVRGVPVRPAVYQSPCLLVRSLARPAALQL